MTDISTAFQTLVNFIFIKYKGCLIERDGKQFKVFGKSYPTEYLAKKKIDLTYINFGKNLIK